MPVIETLLQYDYEGQFSSAGSVSGCSLVEFDDDLDFLTDLGPKFKTLAEICCPPTAKPKPLLTHKASGAVKTATLTEPVFKTKVEKDVETKQVDVKTEKVTSSTNVIKRSVSSVGTTSQSTTLPISARSKVTNVSRSASFNHSASFNRSATLPYPTQTVVLQQQPVYYAPNPVMQPMHYFIQQNPANTILVDDRSLMLMNDPQGLSRLVVNGTQSSYSGLVLQGIDGSMSPKSPVSPTSPIRTTVLMPSSTGSQGLVSMEGCKIVGPNSAGAYVLVNDKSRPGEAEVRDLGSSEGTLPGDVVLVKKAAPPQGVLGSAAQTTETDYSHLLNHIPKKDNNVSQNWYLGQIRFWQKTQTGYGSLVVCKSFSSQLQIWMIRVATVHIHLHTLHLPKRLSRYILLQLEFKSLTNSDNCGQVHFSKYSIQNLSSVTKCNFKHYNYCKKTCKILNTLSIIYNNEGNTSAVNVWSHVLDIFFKMMNACVLYVLTLLKNVCADDFYILVIQFSLAWTQKSFSIYLTY